MNPFSCAAAFTVAYLLGSIPFGLLVARQVKGIDIREHGSRNVGATNVFRVVGKPWGLLVLFLDAFKGAAAVFTAKSVLSEAAFEWHLAAGITAVIGHSFSVWLRFKGGKGVATSLGVFLALVFWPTLLTFLGWCVVFAVFRIISVASLAAALLFPGMVWLYLHEQSFFPSIFVVSLLLLGFIFYTHRANISRLYKGEEKRLF